MDQKPIPRDPHGDNALIDEQIELAGGGQSDSSGGRLATEIGAKDDEASATGGDPEATRAHKGEKAQPFSQTQGGRTAD